jgi:sugar-specific transcriptional regulator TrmB
VVSLEGESLLSSLGLTVTQSKVYLALVCNGPSKVTQISKDSKIHRAHLYQILRSLESNGLVEKNFADGSFSPMPLKEALEMLIKQKRKEIEKLEATAKIISNVSKHQLKLETTPEMLLLTNQTQILKKVQSIIKNSEISIYHMHSWNRFLRLWHNYYEDFSDAMTRGVTIKQIVEFPMDKMQAQSFMAKHVFSDSLCNIRFVPKTGGNFSIIDDQKIVISTSAEKSITDVPPIVTSNYQGLLEILKNYFSLIWENGLTWDEFTLLKNNSCLKEKE